MNVVSQVMAGLDSESLHSASMGGIRGKSIHVHLFLFCFVAESFPPPFFLRSNSEIPIARQRPSASYHQNPYYTSRPSGRRDVVAAHSVGRGHRSRAVANKEEIAVDAIFSAHSDGLMVILRYAS